MFCFGSTSQLFCSGCQGNSIKRSLKKKIKIPLVCSLSLQDGKITDIYTLDFLASIQPSLRIAFTGSEDQNANENWQHGEEKGQILQTISKYFFSDNNSLPYSGWPPPDELRLSIIMQVVC